MASAGAAFTVEVLGRTLGTFAAIRGLEAQVDVLEYREGGINDVVHRLPGALTYPNIVLSNGLTSRAVEEWFAQTRLGAERHTMTVTFLDSAGKAQRAWSFADAFPIRWTGPTLTAGSTAVAGEELEVAHGGMTMEQP
ncbi:MAG: phage tail protein [Solirubrobacteraceae bacterium]|nr:phage tail protein [Solirubrobacteraceae bacterium]